MSPYLLAKLETVIAGVTEAFPGGAPEQGASGEPGARDANGTGAAAAAKAGRAAGACVSGRGGGRLDFCCVFKKPKRGFRLIQACRFQMPVFFGRVVLLSWDP